MPATRRDPGRTSDGSLKTLLEPLSDESRLGKKVPTSKEQDMKHPKYKGKGSRKRTEKEGIGKDSMIKVQASNNQHT